MDLSDGFINGQGNFAAKAYFALAIIKHHNARDKRGISKERVKSVRSNELRCEGS